MWEKIMEAGTGVYILWGLGALGVLLKIIISVYLSGIVKASQDMSTTRKKSLMAIRQKLENRRSLSMDMGSGEAFVDKNVYSLKCMGIPLSSWGRMGRKLCLLVCMAVSGGFLYYDVSWRGSPDMIYFMANGAFVCAFLMLLENIYVVTNNLELLKANIWDYLESGNGYRQDAYHRKKNEGISGESEALVMCRGSDYNSQDNKENNPKEENKLDESAADNEEILNSFLKEFFT